MRKKERGERVYLALEDLRIKSKFLRFIEIGRIEERKNREGRRTNETALA
jgi:hypothetical protein